MNPDNRRTLPPISLRQAKPQRIVVVRERARVVSKQELADYLYPHDQDRDSNVLEVLVGRLRRKLDPEGTLAPIETLRGRGYRFSLE